MLRMPGPDFYATIPRFEGFSHILDEALYRPLPDDWMLGLSDVVRSTQAIGAGAYKAVNTAGAAVITAVRNALAGLDFPFVFGGDGASFAVPPAHEKSAREALQATAAWVRDELGLELRIAAIRVGDIRQAGRDVLVARYAASPHVDYAMFTGGGLGWAEEQMKRGELKLDPAPPGARPDLSGMSCRWGEIPARRGVMLSLLVTPAPTTEPQAFRDLIDRVLGLIAQDTTGGNPVPPQGPSLGWPPTGLRLEAMAGRRAGGSLALAQLRVIARSLVHFLIVRFRIPVGAFKVDRYMRELAENTDFRKYDDGLRMTIDCTPALADRLEALLGEAERDGIAHFGTHRQSSALITCVVRSAMTSDHLHFVDGAMGGYAAAAMRLKARQTA